MKKMSERDRERVKGKYGKREESLKDSPGERRNRTEERMRCWEAEERNLGQEKLLMMYSQEIL